MGENAAFPNSRQGGGGQKTHLSNLPNMAGLGKQIQTNNRVFIGGTCKERTTVKTVVGNHLFSYYFSETLRTISLLRGI